MPRTGARTPTLIKNAIRVAAELAGQNINERIEAQLRNSHAASAAAKAD